MYKKEGFVDTAAVYALVITGILLIVLGIVLVLGAVMVGSIYEETEDSITAITDENVEADVKAAAQSGVGVLKTFGSYQTLFVLAIVVTGLIALIVGALLSRQSSVGNML